MATRNLVTRVKPSFKQQNLPAWQPILTAGTVLPTFFLIGVAFVPIGIGLLMSSTTVQEIVVDYTDCRSINYGQRLCSSIVPLPPERPDEPKRAPCKCAETIELKEDFRREVYVYYGLSNFYQNHRRYVKSRDDIQLLGNPKSASTDCEPFAMDRDKDGQLKPIAPCGAIANSLFNDTFDLVLENFDGKPRNIILSKQGIAWASDKRIRFQNPPLTNGTNLAAAFEGTVPPRNWRRPVYELDKTHMENNGFHNEDLIVWMRTAALPTFRKIWGIIQTSSIQNGLDYLPSGNYTLTINYNYPVTVFNGRKRFIMSNTSWLGGKNNFLGIAYIVVGCICFLISAFFLYIHKKYGCLPSEITQITQTTPYIASGSMS